MSRAVMLFAEGFETGEALVPVDILRRGGVEVTMASIDEKTTVTSAQGISVEMDAVFSELDVLAYDVVILPGGMPGTTHLGESELVREAILSMNQEKKIVAAICAAPGVLGKHGLLQGKNACCYPGLEKNLVGARTTTDAVTVDGNIITSRGLGTAMDCGLTILGALEGDQKADQIRESVVYRIQA